MNIPKKKIPKKWKWKKIISYNVLESWIRLDRSIPEWDDKNSIFSFSKFLLPTPICSLHFMHLFLNPLQFRCRNCVCDYIHTEIKIGLWIFVLVLICRQGNSCLYKLVDKILNFFFFIFLSFFYACAFNMLLQYLHTHVYYSFIYTIKAPRLLAYIAGLME